MRTLVRGGRFGYWDGGRSRWVGILDTYLLLKEACPDLGSVLADLAIDRHELDARPDVFETCDSVLKIVAATRLAFDLPPEPAGGLNNVQTAVLFKLFLRAVGQLGEDLAALPQVGEGT